MASQTNVYAQSDVIVGDIIPDEEKGRIYWGAPAENGRAAWVSVKPFPGSEYHPGEKLLTVTDWSYEATDDGARRIFLTVKNTGVNIIGLFRNVLGVFHWADPNSRARRAYFPKSLFKK